MFFETERLYINELTLEHLPNLFKLQSDPEVVKYSFMANGKPRSLEDVQKTLSALIQHAAKYGYSLGAVHEKHTNEFIGVAGIIHLAFDEKSPINEIGYQLEKKFWGKGYATELSKRILEWGFEEFGFDQIVACTHLDNIASQKVLIKAGMHRKDDIDYKGHQAAYFVIEKNEKLG
jgi:[ribosomal protein S5]-alanine N-acetyltransferase